MHYTERTLEIRYILYNSNILVSLCSVKILKTLNMQFIGLFMTLCFQIPFLCAHIRFQKHSVIISFFLHKRNKRKNKTLKLFEYQEIPPNNSHLLFQYSQALRVNLHLGKLSSGCEQTYQIEVYVVLHKLTRLQLMQNLNV